MNRQQKILAFLAIAGFPLAYVIKSVLFDSLNFYAFWGSTLILHLAFFFTTCFFLIKLGDPLLKNKRGLQSGNFRIFTLILATSIILSFFSNQIPSAGFSGSPSIMNPFQSKNALLLWIWTIAIAAITEEVIYRYVIITYLLKWNVNRLITIFVSSVSFLLIHGLYPFSNLITFLFYFIGGIIFASLFIWKKRTWINILIHYVLHLIGIIEFLALQT